MKIMYGALLLTLPLSGLTIEIRDKKANKYTIEVNDPHATIKTLKEQVNQRKNIPIDKQKIFIAGQEYSDDYPLEQIKHILEERGAYIEYAPLSIKVILRDIPESNSPPIVITLEEAATVYTLKKCIEELLKIPLELQAIYESDKELSNREKIKNYTQNDYGEVTLTLKLEGVITQLAYDLLALNTFLE